jgi:hypothetical protein
LGNLLFQGCTYWKIRPPSPFPFGDHQLTKERGTKKGEKCDTKMKEDTKGEISWKGKICIKAAKKRQKGYVTCKYRHIMGR